jgi:hypothetical protein
MFFDISTSRRRLEAQGFLNLTDTEVLQFDPWLRLAPAMCLGWTIAGVMLASPAILASLVPFALLGAVLPGHPFDVVYNSGLRRVLRTPPLPRYGKPRRFACLMASMMLSCMAASFYWGFQEAGYILGFIMIGMATTTVITGFCVPSLIYGLLFGAPCTEKASVGGYSART